VLRDIDLLEQMAALGLVKTAVSVTTLDDDLKRKMEPRAAGPATRLKVISRLAESNIPVSAMLAPVIPRINDHEIEHILEKVAHHGAHGASYVLLRLPFEVAPLFRDWLAVHYPDRANAALRAIASCRRGKLYDSRFHDRMRGEGLVAEMIARRFQVARRRHGLDRESVTLSTSDFRKPTGPQLSLL
jgi:DNA repair photolyase